MPGEQIIWRQPGYGEGQGVIGTVKSLPSDGGSIAIEIKHRKNNALRIMYVDVKDVMPTTRTNIHLIGPSMPSTIFKKGDTVVVTQPKSNYYEETCTVVEALSNGWTTVRREKDGRVLHFPEKDLKQVRPLIEPKTTDEILEGKFERRAKEPIRHECKAGIEIKLGSRVQIDQKDNVWFGKEGVVTHLRNTGFVTVERDGGSHQLFKPEHLVTVLRTSTGEVIEDLLDAIRTAEERLRATQDESKKRIDTLHHQGLALDRMRLEAEKKFRGARDEIIQLRDQVDVLTCRTAALKYNVEVRSGWLLVTAIALIISLVVHLIRT